MGKSKLEAYEDIIRTLTQEALTIDDIAFKCDMHCVNLQQRLNFLVSNNIVDIEVSRDNRAFYVLTRRGLTISKTLDLTKQLAKLQTPKDTYIKAVSMSAERDSEEATSSC